MIQRSTTSKALALVLAALTVLATSPFSVTETFAASPLGSLVTTGRVRVGSASAPTGTTIFSGDRIEAEEAPALVNLSSGSRMQLAKAAVTLSRRGDTLVLDATRGLVRFNIKKGEQLQINAGRYSFTSAAGGAHVGELGLNQNGQIVLAVSEGLLAGSDTAKGERIEITPEHPMMMLDQSGQGSLTRGGKTLTDTSKNWQPNEHRGKCVVAGGEAYHIDGNTANTLTVRGAWKLTTGSYDYKITDCTRDALIAAGATAGAASAAATGAAAGAAAAGAAAGAAGGVSAATVGIVAAAVAGAVGIGLGIREAVSEDSPSNR